MPDFYGHTVPDYSSADKRAASWLLSAQFGMPHWDWRGSLEFNLEPPELGDSADNSHPVAFLVWALGYASPQGRTYQGHLDIKIHCQYGAGDLPAIVIPQILDRAIEWNEQGKSQQGGFSPTWVPDFHVPESPVDEEPWPYQRVTLPFFSSGRESELVASLMEVA